MSQHGLLELLQGRVKIVCYEQDDALRTANPPLAALLWHSDQLDQRAFTLDNNDFLAGQSSLDELGQVVFSFFDRNLAHGSMLAGTSCVCQISATRQAITGESSTPMCGLCADKPHLGVLTPQRKGDLKEQT